jgi:hypothetical protein
MQDAASGLRRIPLLRGWMNWLWEAYLQACAVPVKALYDAPVVVVGKVSRALGERILREMDLW